jgi:hypothetical protein
MIPGHGRAEFAREAVVRLLLVVAGLMGALLAAELVGAMPGQPRIYQARPGPPPFRLWDRLVEGRPFYVNTPGGMRFVYDGNPRGYFGPANEVDHHTNRLGFRGGELQPEKPPGTLRLVFLGDSFTFGEGVRDADTYAESSRALLSAHATGLPLRVEALNLGVGGYNTSDEERMLRTVAMAYSPDVVVLGYVLNDAEPSLLEYDSVARRVVWSATAGDAPELGANQPPPDTWIHQLRLARLIWRFFANRETSLRTVEFYVSLYAESAAAWDENRQALHDIIELCRSRNVPCIVILFPILHQLDDGYPFAEIHAKVGHEVEEAGGTLIDLLPRLKGRDASELWVHPADHHPNEVVHAIAARELVSAVASLGVIERAAASLPAGG